MCSFVHALSRVSPYVKAKIAYTYLMLHLHLQDTCKVVQESIAFSECSVLLGGVGEGKGGGGGGGGGEGSEWRRGECVASVVKMVWMERGLNSDIGPTV